MPKVAVLIRCYHATEYLERLLKNYSWVDKILIMNFRFNSVAPTTDDTVEIASKFENVEVLSGEGVLQHKILNIGLRQLIDYDYVFISDADEFILPNEQKAMIAELEKTGKYYGYCKIIDYLYDINHKMPDRPGAGYFVTVVRPKMVEFTHIRNFKFIPQKKIDFPYMLHHFGFALKPESLKWKYEWESVEEKTDVEKNVKAMPILECTPPAELVEIICGKPN